ncbi:hypothetical protein GCM10023165_35650 [Variovorax defluvii]|uniref:SDR family NAD(P)-dependent oxidoreductase n=1 Tax=Variovorax defluvii TaxID=913761 RepID=A0ABP8I1K4_9BURK
MNPLQTPMGTSRVVWVAGAAGAAGGAIIDAWIAAGARVVATDVHGCASGEHVTGLACDGTCHSDIDAVIAECRRLGGLDVFVNCAGAMPKAGSPEITVEVWNELFDLNVRGPQLCSQAAAREMVATGKGGWIVRIDPENAETVSVDSVACHGLSGPVRVLEAA